MLGCNLKAPLVGKLLMHTLHVVLPGLYKFAPSSLVDILRGSFSGMPLSGLPLLIRFM